MLQRSTGLLATRQRLERRNSFAFFSEWQERTYGTQEPSFGLAASMLSKEGDGPANKQVVDKNAPAIVKQSVKYRRSATSDTPLSPSLGTPDRNAIVDKKSGDLGDSTDYDGSTVGISSCMSPRSPLSSEGEEGSIRVPRLRSHESSGHIAACHDQDCDDTGGREVDEKDNSHNDGYGCFVMIQNLPRSTTYEKLIEALIFTGFSDCYHIIYLPAVLGNRNRCMGYAFIGMSSRRMAAKLIAAWHRQVHLTTAGVRGPVVAKLAGVQGFQENITKWARSKTGRINQSCFKPHFFPVHRY